MIPRPLTSPLFPYTTLFRSMLLDRGLLHGDCLTVTGHTLAENLAKVEPYPEDQDIIRAFDNPVKADSHLRILHGDRKSTRLNSSHVRISYAVFCLKKKTSKQ